jgi:hypothetical protein
MSSNVVKNQVWSRKDSTVTPKDTDLGAAKESQYPISFRNDRLARMTQLAQVQPSRSCHQDAAMSPKLVEGTAGHLTALKGRGIQPPHVCATWPSETS